MERRQREVDEELNQKRTERSRLDRIGRSLPLIGKLKSFRETLVDLADAPLLPETFSADRREADINLKNARRDEERARKEIERLEAELSCFIR